MILGELPLPNLILEVLCIKVRFLSAGPFQRGEIFPFLQANKQDQSYDNGRAHQEMENKGNRCINVQKFE